MATPMERQDDPQLWDLLGYSKTPEPSAFFARNVLRRIREEEPSRGGFTAWLGWRRLIPTLSAVTAMVVAVFTLHTVRNDRPPQIRNEIASAAVSDTELAADLDVLSGDDDNDDAPLL